MHCSVAQCLELVGDWWTLLIIRDVFLGVRRFDEFQQRLGISRNILIQRLTSLVDHDILEKQPYSEHPPRYEYQLTEKGRDLWSVLVAMRQWGDKYAAPDGPPVTMIHKACGNEAQAIMTCSSCGEPLTPHDITTRPGPGDVDGIVPAPRAPRPAARGSRPAPQRAAMSQRRP